MSSFRAYTALLVALCLVPMITECSSPTGKWEPIYIFPAPPAETPTWNPVDFLQTTTEPPRTCTPDCYSESECAEVVEVARAALSLEKSLGFELGNQLHLLSPSSESTSVCNITRSEWDEKSQKLIKKLEGSEGPTCNLKLPSDSAICAAFVKLSKCTVSHLRIAYERYCLTGSTHEAWWDIMDDVGSFTGLLDIFFESKLPYRQDEWKEIKSSVYKLAGSVKSLARGYKCPPGLTCVPIAAPGVGSVKNGDSSAYLSQRADVDETWFVTEKPVLLQWRPPDFPEFAITVDNSGVWTQPADVDETWRMQSSDDE